MRVLFSQETLQAGAVKGLILRKLLSIVLVFTTQLN